MKDTLKTKTTELKKKQKNLGHSKLEEGNESGKGAGFREIQREEIVDSNIDCIENLM